MWHKLSCDNRRTLNEIEKKNIIVSILYLFSQAECRWETTQHQHLLFERHTSTNSNHSSTKIQFHSHRFCNSANSATCDYLVIFVSNEFVRTSGQFILHERQDWRLCNVYHSFRYIVFECLSVLFVSLLSYSSLVWWKRCVNCDIWRVTEWK